MIDELRKKCSVCQEIKSVNDFYARKLKRGISVRSECKKCSHQYTYRDRNKKRAAGEKVYGKKSKTPKQKSSVQYYLDTVKNFVGKINLQDQNKKKCNICNEIFDLSLFPKNFSRCKPCHKSILSQHDKKQYQKNKQQKLEKKKAYHKNNRHKINARKQWRYKNEPAYKLHCCISSSINGHFKHINSGKNGMSVFNFLPYTKKQLKQYMESLFEPWMNWNNYASYNPKTWKDNEPTTWTWTLDHIIPVSKFNIKIIGDNEFLKCWALENLRPYSAKQNTIDGNRR